MTDCGSIDLERCRWKMKELQRYRHNVLHVRSIQSFVNIRGGVQQGCRDVYFVRIIGCTDSLAGEIQKMNAELTAQMREGKLYYKRMGTLARLAEPDQVYRYAECYAQWVKSRQDGIRTQVSAQDPWLARQLGAACGAALSQYARSRPVTDSMKKNFAIKLLYWFDTVFLDRNGPWDDAQSRKIAAENVTKEQEYLFYYLLTLLGCDVLLLQSRADVAAADTVKSLSDAVEIGPFRQEALPVYEVPKLAHPERVKLSIPKKNSPVPVVRHDLSSRTEKSFEELAKLASSIVQIAVHNKDGEVAATASGIMVGKAGYILTNYHVAARGYTYSVRIEDDDAVYQTDEWIKYHSVLDLAILRIKRELQPLPIYSGTKELVRGQAVAAIGSPLGMFNSVSNGIISGFRTVNGVPMIQFTAPISHGSSGGALLNMCGEVIGISTAGFDEGQNINLAVGYESIRMFVRGFV